MVLKLFPKMSIKNFPGKKNNHDIMIQKLPVDATVNVQMYFDKSEEKR